MFRKHKYVWAVYKEKSFTKAAEKLFISQPSLSAAIKNLEKELGAPLFDRLGAEATLTEIGREYIVAAEKIMRIEKEFDERVNDLRCLGTGAVRVGGASYLSSYVLPKIIKKFVMRYPRIKVSFVEADSNHLSAMLERGEIDIIVDSFDDTMDMYEGYPLTREHIFLCVPKSNPINRELQAYCIHPQDIYEGRVDASQVPCVPIEKFRNERFVLLKTGNDMCYRAEQLLATAGIEPTVSFRVDQLNTSRALAETGMGCAFVTDTLFRFWQGGDNLLLYNIVGDNLHRTLYVVHKKHRYRTNAMAQFMLAAQEIFENP